MRFFDWLRGTSPKSPSTVTEPDFVEEVLACLEETVDSLDLNKLSLDQTDVLKDMLMAIDIVAETTALTDPEYWSDIQHMVHEAQKMRGSQPKDFLTTAVPGMLRMKFSEVAHAYAQMLPAQRASFRSKVEAHHDAAFEVHCRKIEEAKHQF